MEYVVGYAFSPDFKRVLLIRKNRPEWQAGKLNGVGGKVEKYEDIFSAMHREYYEETGYNCTTTDWHLIQCSESSDDTDWKIAYFAGIIDIDKAQTTTDEKLEIHDVNKILFTNELIYTCYWMIPMAIIALRMGDRWNVRFEKNDDKR